MNSTKSIWVIEERAYRGRTWWPFHVMYVSADEARKALAKWGSSFPANQFRVSEYARVPENRNAR